MPLRAQAAPVEAKAANLQVYRDPEVPVDDRHPSAATNWLQTGTTTCSAKGEPGG